MPATTREAVVLTAPELSAYPAGADWDQAIADAELELAAGASRFGRRWEMVNRYLVAHMMTIRKSGRGGSPRVQSESVGGIVSRTYAVSVGLDAKSLDQTAYGQEVLAIMRAVGAGPQVL